MDRSIEFSKPKHFLRVLYGAARLQNKQKPKGMEGCIDEVEFCEYLGNVPYQTPFCNMQSEEIDRIFSFLGKTFETDIYVYYVYIDTNGMKESKERIRRMG